MSCINNLCTPGELAVGLELIKNNSKQHIGKQASSILTLPQVPASTYVPPAEIELLARQRELQKEKAQVSICLSIYYYLNFSLLEDKLKQADRLQFSCAKTDKSLKTKVSPLL